MADGIVGLALDGAGKKVDTTELTVGVNLVERQRVHLSGTLPAAIVEPINAIPIGTEYAIPIRQVGITTDTVGTAVALNALNAACVVSLAGQRGCSLTLTAPTAPLLTIVAELSFDGGITYPGGVSFESAADVFSASIVNPAGTFYELVMDTGGASHARVRVSAYTSGTITGQLRATAIPDAPANLCAPGTAFGYPPLANAIAVSDSLVPTTPRAVLGASADPLGTDMGMIVRVAGTVKTMQKGITWRQTIAGTAAPISVVQPASATTLQSVTGIQWYTNTAGWNLKVLDGATVIWQSDISQQNIGQFNMMFNDEDALQNAVINTALTITLTPAGTETSCALNVQGYM